MIDPASSRRYAYYLAVEGLPHLSRAVSLASTTYPDDIISECKLAVESFQKLGTFGDSTDPASVETLYEYLPSLGRALFTATQVLPVSKSPGKHDELLVLARRLQTDASSAPEKTQRDLMPTPENELEALIKAGGLHSLFGATKINSKADSEHVQPNSVDRKAETDQMARITAAWAAVNADPKAAQLGGLGSREA